MHNNNQERRRYFRIVDQVAISYRLLSEEEGAAAGLGINSPAALVVQLENQISASLETLRSIQPQVHELLELFNRKINLVLALDDSISESDSDQIKRAQQVNISACGIAFPSNEQLKPNDKILLELTLFPSNICLKMVSVVIGSELLEEPVGNDAYIIRADFLDISSNEQEVLVQHIIKRQTMQLKERRESRQK
ncbi:PilZ domain-containing protein [Alkalimarinus alittae]|uniref:PilZ domain-containing protein n=1 Tax=Alkalimarinus alittae TaxID=2961619 RepID=A0ABY6N0B5_9ALTE|nr:hypothetical protein [Alkalimarinus alittae]UZE95541.1 hypothetical protein NKI27_15940 [Alkalimarinus alittae]